MRAETSHLDGLHPKPTNINNRGETQVLKKTFLSFSSFLLKLNDMDVNLTFVRYKGLTTLMHFLWASFNIVSNQEYPPCHAWVVNLEAMKSMILASSREALKKKDYLNKGKLGD